MSTRKTDTFYEADAIKAIRLLGLKDTTITLTRRAYENMSHEFKRIVELRNLKIEVIECL